MLIEQSLNEALKSYIKGKKVVVIIEQEDGKMDVNLLSDFLGDRNYRYLVETPAVPNLEFRQAVQDMVRAKEVPTPEQIVPAVPHEREDESGSGNENPPPEEAEVVMVPANKSKKEIVLDLAGQGLTAPEIAKQTGIKYNTVYAYLNPEKCKKKSGKQEKETYKPGWNADRHACRTCIYGPSASDRSRDIGCNYCEFTGHSRKSDPSDCDKYVKGKRITRKKDI